MCGIVGFKHTGPPVDPALTRRLVEALLRWSKVRGLHATGIAWTDGEKLSVLKRPLPADEFMKLLEWDAVWAETPKSGILHTRYSTSGDSSNNTNNQPIAISQLAIVHNGLVSMATKEEFEQQYDVKTATENDSEIILRKIVQHLRLGKEMGSAIQDGLTAIHNVHPPIFAFGLMDVHGELYCVRDHIRPLYLWSIPDLNLSGFCSTRDIFMRACMDCRVEPHAHHFKEFFNGITRLTVNGPIVPHLFSTASYHLYYTDPVAPCFRGQPLHFNYPDDHKFTRPDGLLSGVDKSLLQNDILTTDAALDYAPNPKRDFRSLKDRREGFIQYYAAEMLSDIDPAFPAINEIFDRYELSLEQQYWMAFLYAVFYENATIFLVQQEFPELEKIDIGRLERWHAKHWKTLQYQTDRRWNKGHFVEMVKSYKALIGNQTQHQFFTKLMAKFPTNSEIFGKDDPKQSFRNVWAALLKVHKMGRHSVYAWTETLIRCLGLPMECDSFFMDEAESSRNGLCYALGRDDLVTKHDKKLASNERISKIEIKWLEDELEKLMAELKQRWPHLPVDYMYVETVCCSYKGLFRSRRYLGYYLDRMAMEVERGRTKMAEISQGIDWQTLWQIRSEIFIHEFLGELQTDKPWLDIRWDLCEVFNDTGRLINFGPIVKRGLADLDACLKP